MYFTFVHMVFFVSTKNAEENKCTLLLHIWIFLKHKRMLKKINVLLYIVFFHKLNKTLKKINMYKMGLFFSSSQKV